MGRTLKKFNDLSFFDNLALVYLCRETPPPTLALVFLEADPKIAGSLLGVLDTKRRAYIHKLMSEAGEVSEETRKAAVDGLLLIAENLLQKDLITKKGNYYFGKEMDVRERS